MITLTVGEKAAAERVEVEANFSLGEEEVGKAGWDMARRNNNAPKRYKKGGSRVGFRREEGISIRLR